MQSPNGTRRSTVRLRDPHWYRQRVVHRLLRPVHRHLPDGGIDFMDQDWDNLLILDGCRADLFRETVDPSPFDAYDDRTSVGSATPEWARKTFRGREFPDTVYVSGNPQISRYGNDSFHRLYELWDTDFTEDHRTILPEAITATTLDAHEKHPNKRLVAHFMQPHHPFIATPDSPLNPTHNPDAPDPWIALSRGEVERDTVWTEYSRNLNLVMNHVVRLLDELNGKTVVTSDHGNLLGERLLPIPIRMYGHPREVRHRDLQRIPWAVADGPRRDIHTETISVNEADSQKIEERLESLGYK